MLLELLKWLFILCLFESIFYWEILGNPAINFSLEFLIVAAQYFVSMILCPVIPDSEINLKSTSQISFYIETYD